MDYQLQELGLQPHIWAVPLIGIIVFVPSLAAALFGRDSYGSTGVGIIGVLGSALGLGALIVGACLAIPYDSSYWKYYHVQGTLSDVSNRFESASGDNPNVGSWPAVIGDQQVVMQDSRIFNYKEGDEVDLTCTIEWVYEGQDKLNCFVRSY